MNLHVLYVALLLFCARNVYGRAIDDINNSIDVNDKNNNPVQFEEDWIKLTKIPPAKVLQNLGSSVEIACEVMGSQVPKIQWVYGHFPISEIDNLETNVISESSSSAIVRVRSVHIIDQMLNEPHTYTCIGRTGSKTVYASTVVYPQTDFNGLMQVREKFLLGGHKPKIIYSEKLHLDLVGSNILLPCKVYAHPHAEVFWMNGDGKLIEQNNHFKILPSGDLLIPEIKWEDMGAYKCIAKNSIGKDTSDTFVYPVLKEEK